jgi:serine/threonine kinase 38
MISSFVSVPYFSKISVKDFIPRKIIGRGAFGEVRVCRDRKTNEVVAIKKMKK